MPLKGKKLLFSNEDEVSHLQDVESKNVPTYKSDPYGAADEQHDKAKPKQRRVQFEDLYDAKSIKDIQRERLSRARNLDGFRNRSSSQRSPSNQSRTPESRSPSRFSDPRSQPVHGVDGRGEESKDRIAATPVTPATPESGASRPYAIPPAGYALSPLSSQGLQRPRNFEDGKEKLAPGDSARSSALANLAASKANDQAENTK